MNTALRIIYLAAAEIVLAVVLCLIRGLALAGRALQLYVDRTREELRLESSGEADPDGA